MKNILLALILSASSYAFGQEKKNMHYKENHQLQMYRFDENSKIYIENKYPPLYFEIRKLNLDSLIQIVKSAYEKLDISIEPFEAKTIVLELNMSQPKDIILPDAIQTKISIQKRQNASETFGLTKSNETVRIKNQYDSLVFKLTYYTLPSYLLDSVANQKHKFPKEGYDLLLSVVTPDFEKISFDMESKIKLFHWFLRNSEKSLKKRNKIVDKAEVFFYENSSNNSLITVYNKNPTTFFIKGNFSSSIGWINNQFIPSFGGSFTFNFKKIKIGLLSEAFLIPELIPSKGKSKPLSMSGLFVNFSSKMNYSSKNNMNQGGFGYQIGKIEETENINPIFNGWTSRAFIRVPINKYFSVEPEMMGGFFNKKGVNSSLRLRINL